MTTWIVLHPEGQDHPVITQESLNSTEIAKGQPLPSFTDFELQLIATVNLDLETSLCDTVDGWFKQIFEM